MNQYCLVFYFFVVDLFVQYRQGVLLHLRELYLVVVVLMNCVTTGQVKVAVVHVSVWFGKVVFHIPKQVSLKSAKLSNAADSNFLLNSNTCSLSKSSFEPASRSKKWVKSADFTWIVFFHGNKPIMVINQKYCSGTLTIS